jgi:hypothetical protein
MSAAPSPTPFSTPTRTISRRRSISM